MSKYSFERMSASDFESMAQALLESTYRPEGNLIQFGEGKDGGREATWTQPATHPTYRGPANETGDAPKEWVFQVKYHDIGQRGWAGARNDVLRDLENELDKIVHKHKVPCHAYVMITNVPFTGARGVGTRDKATAIAKNWESLIPEILVWDAADLSRMLDADESVRTAYLDQVLPGDVLKAIYKGVQFQADRRKSALRAYLDFVVERESAARAEEAGDEPGLPLAEVFIDLDVKLRQETRHESIQSILEGWGKAASDSDSPVPALVPKDLSQAPASFALLLADYPYVLVLGAPGLGKSTLAQFVVLYHAARLVNKELAARLAARLKLHDGFGPEHLDAACAPQFPFRIELRRYARWMTEQQNNDRQGELARYIAEMLVNPNVSASLGMDDIFALAATDPVLVVLDGLDEVPNPEARKQILENLQVFLRRVKAENGTVQVMLCSRPKGYSGEFEGFEPLAWEINELERADFDDYCKCWLAQRIRDVDERRDACERIDRGMKSDAVQRLARSLLQATVMLTIVRRKSEIPHQRHDLYRKYVEVVFDREKEKWPVVRDCADELLQLHERVGYELHRAMEKQEVEALGPEAFRGYVLNVLQEYSAVDLGDKKLKEVADEIITAATDRLCFLAGKGAEQRDIDFVIQSFREYFAARFLFNHPDADPERVFPTLVQRGAYWANVLQFYVAMASPNQQLRWVMSAEGASADASSASGFLELTRTRRALMNVLPELTLKRTADFDRALRVILGPETLWTWGGQEYAPEILGVVRSGTAVNMIWGILDPQSSDDLGTLAGELAVLGPLTPRHTEQHDALRRVVQDLLSTQGGEQIGLLSAVKYDLEVDLSESPLSTSFIQELLFASRGPRWAPRLIRSQTPRTRCEIVLYWRRHFADQDTFCSRILETLGLREPTPWMEFSCVRFSLPPYLRRARLEAEDSESLIAELADVGSSSALYVQALVRAAAEPTNAQRDREARQLEAQLPNADGIELRTDELLGPGVDQFSSPERWREFKERVVDLASAHKPWIGPRMDLTGPAWLWTAFSFHPDHWPVLVAEGVFSSDEEQQLRSSPLGEILALCAAPLRVFSGFHVPRQEAPAPGAERAFLAAMKVAEKHGAAQLSGGWFLPRMLTALVPRPMEQTLSDDLLRSAKDLSALSRVWTSAILTISLLAPAPDPHLLLRFWERHEKSRPIVWQDRDAETPHDTLMQQLLADERESALRLAATIAPAVRLGAHTADRLRQRLIPRLDDVSTENEWRIRFLRALAGLGLSLEEFSVWQRRDVIALLLDEAPWLYSRLCNRLVRAGHPTERLPPRKIVDCLAPFVTDGHAYAPKLARAALKATLDLDSRELPALSDADWQQQS